MAFSSDGLAFTKIGDVMGLGYAGTFDSIYLEHSQHYYFDNIHYILYEGSNGTTWGIGSAWSYVAEGPYTKHFLQLSAKSGIVGSFDRYHVATPSMSFINGKWCLFYQGCANVTLDNWTIGMTNEI